MLIPRPMGIVFFNLENTWVKIYNAIYRLLGKNIIWLVISKDCVYFKNQFIVNIEYTLIPYIYIYNVFLKVDIGCQEVQSVLIRSI
jgi:hypothetical protein